MNNDEYEESRKTIIEGRYTITMFGEIFDKQGDKHIPLYVHKIKDILQAEWDEEDFYFEQ